MAAVRKALLGLGLFAALLIVGSARASYLVTVDTSNLSGPGALAFDLIDGDGSIPSTTVTISGFSPDASLGTARFNGVDLSNNLSAPVMFSDTDLSGFNEYLQQITLGSVLSFVLDVTGPSGSFHDTLSFYITDTTGIDTLVATDMGGALLTWDAGVDDPAQPTWYQGTVISQDPNAEPLAVTITATAVPEPGALPLVSAALLALGLMRLADKGRIRRRLPA